MESECSSGSESPTIHSFIGPNEVEAQHGIIPLAEVNLQGSPSPNGHMAARKEPQAANESTRPSLGKVQVSSSYQEPAPPLLLNTFLGRTKKVPTITKKRKPPSPVKVAFEDGGAYFKIGDGWIEPTTKQQSQKHKCLALDLCRMAKFECIGVQRNAGLDNIEIPRCPFVEMWSPAPIMTTFSTNSTGDSCVPCRTPENDDSQIHKDMALYGRSSFNEGWVYATIDKITWHGEDIIYKGCSKLIAGGIDVDEWPCWKRVPYSEAWSSEINKHPYKHQGPCSDVDEAEWCFGMYLRLKDDTGTAEAQIWAPAGYMLGMGPEQYNYLSAKEKEESKGRLIGREFKLKLSFQRRSVILWKVSFVLPSDQKAATLQVPTSGGSIPDLVQKVESLGVSEQPDTVSEDQASKRDRVEVPYVALMQLYEGLRLMSEAHELQGLGLRKLRQAKLRQAVATCMHYYEFSVE